MAALDHLIERGFHIVAKVIETKFVIGPISDIGGVRLAAFIVIETMDDAANAHADALINTAHPFGIAAGEIIIDGDDVDAFAGQGIEVYRQGRDQGFSFPGFHFGDFALMEDNSA